MKKLYVLSLLTVCACDTNAQSTTNLVGVQFSGAPPPPSITRVPEPTIFRRATWRIEDRADSRLVHRLVLDLYLGDPEIAPEEFFAKRGKSLFANGLQYSFREWGLQTPAYYWLDDNVFSPVGSWFSSFARDTISGREERNTVQPPDTVEFVAERQRFRGFKGGFRPFYAFGGYGWRNSVDELLLESTLRISLDDWREPAFSFVTEIPVHTWSLGAGIKVRGGGDRENAYWRNGRIFTDIDRAFDIPVGLKGHFCGGRFHASWEVLGERAVVLWRKEH